MKLGNRMFLGVFGLIVFSTLAGAVTGALLISQAVRAEAFSRVEKGLRGARAEIERRQRDLALAARILAHGLEDRLELLIVRIIGSGGHWLGGWGGVQGQGLGVPVAAGRETRGEGEVEE